MSNIGIQFAEKLFALGELMGKYPHARSKRKELEAELQSRIDDLESFCEKPEVEAYVESFLKTVENHAKPDGTSVDVSDFLKGTAEEFMAAERAGTVLAR